MDYNVFRAVYDYLEEKSKQLMKQEAKNAAKVGFPFSNYRSIKVGNREFCLVLSGNVSIEIFDGLLIEACTTYPEKFGTGNASDVIEALYKIVPWGKLEDYHSLIGSEQFCYIVELTNGKVVDKLLRIDLFRMIKPNSNGGSDFIGGLFHALKHFSFNDIPLCTGTEKHNIAGINQLVGDISIGFFTVDGNFKTGANYMVKIPLDDKYELRLEFYYEKNTGVYFLNTCFKQLIQI